MTEVAIPRSVEVPITKVTAYWKNPRRIPVEAVEAVKRSIEEFGYQQPIVVDSDYVIIVGHTRFEALKQLGETKVVVNVANLPEEKVREYRLIDNRTAEMSSWDYDALVVELREFEAGLLAEYFPDFDLEIGQVDSMRGVTQKDVDDAAEEMLKVNAGDPRTAHTTQVVCPACFDEFSVRTKSLPGMTYGILDELVMANGEAE